MADGVLVGTTVKCPHDRFYKVWIEQNGVAAALLRERLQPAVSQALCV